MSERTMQPIIECYSIDEEILYQKPFLFIKGFATGKNLQHTLRALPLARKVHNGQYRKGLVEFNGQMVQLPYILHCLKVCSTLISLQLPLSHDEEDILLSCALLHDCIEDCEEYFPKGGIELVSDYGFPQEVYETIKLLSKHSGATEYELNVYFNNIKKNKFALLVKMADRSHNVEDLYNMKSLHKYVKETRDYVYLLSSYAKANYPELSSGVTILKSKIVSLTELTETLVHRHEEIISEKDKEIAELKEKLKEYEN